MNTYNIHTKDFFRGFSNKIIWIVDIGTGNPPFFKVKLYIDGDGKPTDKKMDYWEDCENTNNIHWCYDDGYNPEHCFTNSVQIIIVENANSRPCKRRKRYKL
jgi:hypothetical protein